MCYLFIATAIWVFAGCGGDGKSTPTDAGGDLQTSAAFADTSLEAAVRQALKRPVGALREVDLAGLGELEGRGRGIVSLQGIGQLANLTRLDLADNRIEDLAPLASLSKLQFLDLDNNQVRDLSALAGLSQLEVVVLGHNQVQDLTPLLGLSRLRSAELSGNPLNGGVENAQLAALQEKGVEVSFQVGGTPPEEESSSSNPVFRLAFVQSYKTGSGGIKDIFLVKTDGSEPINLTNKPAEYYGDLAWSPDGSQLAFIARDDFFIHGVNVFVVNEDGSDLRRLLDRYDSYGYLTWSPDGTRLACTRWSSVGSAQLVAIDVATGELTPLTDGNDSEPVWSPDGGRIAFKRDAEHVPVDAPWGTTTIPIYDLYAMETDGSNLVKLTDSAAHVSDLSWSPGGTRLSFTQIPIRERNPEPAEIYLATTDGGSRINLTSSPEAEWEPVWSPDGTKIAFSSSPGVEGGPVWSPGGVLIAFSSYEGSDTEIYVMNADGSGRVNLSRDPGLNTSPHWSPDGRAVAYLHYPDNSTSPVFYMVNTDGSQRVELLKRGDLELSWGFWAWAPR